MLDKRYVYTARRSVMYFSGCSFGPIKEEYLGFKDAMSVGGHSRIMDTVSCLVTVGLEFSPYILILTDEGHARGSHGRRLVSPQ